MYGIFVVTSTNYLKKCYTTLLSSAENGSITVFAMASHWLTFLREGSPRVPDSVIILHIEYHIILVLCEKDHS